MMIFMTDWLINDDIYEFDLKECTPACEGERERARENRKKQDPKI